MSDDLASSREASRARSVMHRRQGAADSFFGYFDHPLQLLPVPRCAASKPHRDGVRQCALDGGAIERHKQVLFELVSLLRKWMRCCASLTSNVVFSVQERWSDMQVPRSLKEGTFSTRLS